MKRISFNSNIPVSLFQRIILKIFLLTASTYHYTLKVFLLGASMDHCFYPPNPLWLFNMMNGKLLYLIVKRRISIHTQRLLNFCLKHTQLRQPQQQRMVITITINTIAPNTATIMPTTEPKKLATAPAAPPSPPPPPS